MDMFHNFMLQRKLRNHERHEKINLRIQKKFNDDDDDGIEESIVVIVAATAGLCL